MIATIDRLAAARAAALFVSDLSAAGNPTGPEVADAISRAVRAHGGSGGCAADVAAAYGDYPEQAARRMCWARNVIAEIYTRHGPPPLPPRSRPASSGRPRTAIQRCLVAA